MRAGMGVAVVGEGTPDDGDVRFWRRLVVEVDGILSADDPAGWDRRAQRIARHLDAGRVLAAFRLRDDELAADELERLALLERAKVDEPLIFDALPAPQRQRCLLHEGSVAIGASLVNLRRLPTVPA